MEQLTPQQKIESRGRNVPYIRSREFGGFSTWGEFFNVQSGSLDLHVRWPRLGAAFAVVKPSHVSGGKTLSIQFFDDVGHSALKVFLNFSGKPSAKQEEQFATLKRRFARS